MIQITYAEVQEAHRLALQWGLKSQIIHYTIPKIYVEDKVATTRYPSAEPTTNVIYVHKMGQVAAACATLEYEALIDGSVLGFDCEWKPGNNPTAVIQLSSAHTSVVFHLTFLRKGKTLPAPLAALLANNNITKIVMGPADARRMFNEFRINIAHIDIQQLPVSLRLSGVGLATMVSILFQEQVSKEVKLTNWNLPLTSDQIQYAALDAELTRRLYFELIDLPLD